MKQAAIRLGFVFLGCVLSTLLLASHAADPGYEQDWILVRLAEPLQDRAADDSYPVLTGIDELDALIAGTGIWRIESGLPVSTRNPVHPGRLRASGLDRIYRFFVPAGADIPAMAERFGEAAGVEYAELDAILRIDSVYPDDARFDDQWNLEQGTGVDIDAPEAWAYATGHSVIIGMNDSGVDSDHEDLAGKILPGWDFVNNDDDPEDDNGHGTRTTSVATANTNNAVGIAGVCWNCVILPAKVFDANGNGSAARSADGYVWLADHGARIINQSGGSPIPNQTLHNGVIYAYEAGCVMASGTGNKNSQFMNYPAAYSEVIASGGTNSLDQRASFSNYGAQIDVVSPAQTILTAQRGGGYSNANGNSFAGPHVSGLVGLIETIYPSAGRDEARHLVHSGAEDQVGNPAEDVPGWDQYYGWGRINAERTLAATEASITLRVEGSGSTRLYYETANALALSYDFVRGDLGLFSETVDGVDVGAVVCLEDDSPDADTAGGNEDTATPLPGGGFFYLGRFNSVTGAGQYGGSTRNRDRHAAGGDCAE